MGKKKNMLKTFANFGEARELCNEYLFVAEIVRRICRDSSKIQNLEVL